jgi:hypothetical protein
MRFSEQHEVKRPEGSDWPDANVEMDSPLYVDPFLLFEDEDPAWEGAHDEIVDFFDATVDLLKLPQGHRESMHWVKAQRFLQFPEPKEFALGLSLGHPEGSGIGPDPAREMSFIHGADTQLPIYLKGEKAPFGIYMCIGYFDKDFDQGRLDLVNDACDAITTQGKTRIVPIFVDARPRASASRA